MPARRVRKPIIETREGESLVLNHPKKTKQCAYCGETRPVTSDHIPPRNLFPKPRTSNLITVPCCVDCQKGWSKDDEYFRAVILSSAKVSEEALAQGAIDPLLRSVSWSPGFAHLIIDKIKDIELVTEAGIYVDDAAAALELDVGRLDRVAQRIIRGLFFHEKKIPLPKNYKVIAKIQQFGLETILDSISEIVFPEPRVIQNGVFSYTFHDTTEDPLSGIWLLLFYNKLPIVGFTRCP